MNAPEELLAPSFDQRALQYAEAEVIAGAVLEPEHLSRTALEPRHFTPGPNRELWAVLMALREEGETIDQVSIAERCEAENRFENFTYLGELIANSVPGNWEHKASRILARAQAVDVWRRATRAVNQRNEAEIVLLAEDIVARQAAGTRRAVQAPIDIAYEAMQEEWAASRERAKLTWGIRDLDRWVKPMEPTRLHVIAARPALGKTAFCLNVAIANARAGRKVGFISVEQSMEELTARTLCILAECGLSWINGEDTPPANEVAKIDAAKRELRGLPIVINDATPMTIAQCTSWARSLVQRHGCELLIVDYVQKLRSTAKERHVEIAQVVMGLKDIARNLQVPVLAAAQLKRDAEGRSPTMADLRDSGFIEQEADVLLALHREEPDDDDDQDAVRRKREALQVYVLKHRHGQAGLRINVAYRGEQFRFIDAEGRFSK